MRESIGSTVLYNIVIVFLSIIFALILGTMVYYKSFKVNKALVSIIEKYEGYNLKARDAMYLHLKSIGYTTKDLGFCPVKNGETSLVNSNVTNKIGYPICIYLYKKDSRNYSYGIISYITIDMPFIDGRMFKYGIYSETDNIFKFNTGVPIS